MSLGIIGGSGLYEIDGLTDINEIEVETPFGKPSAKFVTGFLDSVKLIFLPRHGKGHHLLPSEIPFRANIWGLKKLGATQVISLSAVGSLRSDIKPGDAIIIDQFIDRTKGRTKESTFFGNGIAAHILFANPTCQQLSDVVEAGIKKVDWNVHRGGTYLSIEGPALSTYAESKLYQNFGASVIGMTNLQEAKLAREAELCYVTVALCTDYDAWKQAPGSIEDIVQIIKSNVKLAKASIKSIATILKGRKFSCLCNQSLKYSIITDSKVIPAETKSKLELIIGKYLTS